MTGLLIDRDLPLIERARALQWYKGIKFPMGEHAPREEKRLSKEGLLGSCSVRERTPQANGDRKAPSNFFSFALGSIEDF